MLHAKEDWQKNIVRNEGIEKKIPEHKDSMKKNSFLQEITPPPPPSKVKWSAPKHWYIIGWHRGFMLTTAVNYETGNRRGAKAECLYAEYRAFACDVMATMLVYVDKRILNIFF